VVHVDSVVVQDLEIHNILEVTVHTIEPPDKGSCRLAAVVHLDWDDQPRIPGLQHGTYLDTARDFCQEDWSHRWLPFAEAVEYLNDAC